jgi:SAM-dependent methyltransferase
MSPLSNALLTAEQLGQPERFYPLCAYVCESCYLVQLPEFESPETIFTDYVYFSSYSSSWLAHAKAYAEAMIRRLHLDRTSRVIEVASNDGYLLQYFAAAGIPVLGIEPAANVARAAEARGIPTLVKFFGGETAGSLAREGRKADLLVGNNVLAHVPDLNDFVAGMAAVLAERGTITMEFPHLLRLIEETQFDTIYHEHFSYFSLHTATQVFARHGLAIYDMDELPTHGGSLRIYARHAREGGVAGSSVAALLDREHGAGLAGIEAYRRFDSKVHEAKRRLLGFLIEAKNQGKTLAGYGAAAKGNTLLNYCGIRTDFLEYVVDRNPHKQGRFLPGTHIPVLAPERVGETRPDYLLVLPWNLKREVVEQMSWIRDWGGKFVIPMPRVEVV